MIDKQLEITVDIVTLPAILKVPENPEGLVIFAHGSGSSRNSPRNQYVAEQLRKHNLATLLFDLLTEKEDQVKDAHFDISLLTTRLEEVTEWTKKQEELRNLNKGYFGSSTGAAAALSAASEYGNEIKAVVSRGGRTDLAKTRLNNVKASTLLIVGEQDKIVRKVNRETLNKLNTEKELKIIPGANHLFQEQLDEVAEQASHWFQKHLK